MSSCGQTGLISIRRADDGTFCASRVVNVPAHKPMPRLAGDILGNEIDRACRLRVEARFCFVGTAEVSLDQLHLCIAGCVSEEDARSDGVADDLNRSHDAVLEVLRKRLHPRTETAG